MDVTGKPWMLWKTGICKGMFNLLSPSFSHVWGLLMSSPSVYDFFFNVRTNQANFLDYKAPSKLINLMEQTLVLNGL